MESFKFLENKSFIKEFQVLDFFYTNTARYFKLKITFINKTVLFAREYVDAKERNYAYHWQDNDNNLICRWDNAPHHEHLRTYPHHLHKNGQPLPLESKPVTLYSVLDTIEKEILS
ncbi:MAG: toxin-antitoxin system TumE family protein [Bacteroidota bacterium]